jgi:glutamate dehydrogenase/leucine dehydrogenase
MHAARFLAERGSILVAVADSRSMVANPDGLDVAELIALKGAGRSVREYERGQERPREDLIGVDCDIWLPAARPDAIRADNVAELKARCVLPGANIAVALDVESTLHERGVVVVPDFVANAGGVICAAVEYHGGTEAGAFQAIEEKVRKNARHVLERAQAENVPPREAAVAFAEERVRAAMRFRRSF